ncbi:MAG: hypothetical protein AB7F19_04590 [Candidatus Babeliales bacterium]
MSKNYEFLAMLNTEYTEENILSILENGSQLGCIYQDSQNNIVSNTMAKRMIWMNHLHNIPPLIELKHYKTHFDIWFYNRNNKIYLYLGPTHIAWKKRYDLCNWYGINFYRYQMFMLGLIGNNIITHFETYEYFYDSYNAESKNHNKKIYVKLYTYWPYDIYHHFKVNSHMLRITWLDSNKQPINMKKEDNTLETILYNEKINQCWFAVYNNITLKFSLHKKHVFTIEPIVTSDTLITMNQEQIFDLGLRATIELFKNMPVMRFITFQNDEDIEIINKMDEWP